MNWRLASRLSVITLAILVAVIVAVIGSKADQQTSNPNTPIDLIRFDGNKPRRGSSTRFSPD